MLKDWVFDGLLSTSVGPNGNQVGATAAFLGLTRRKSGGFTDAERNALHDELLRHTSMSKRGLWYTVPLPCTPDFLCHIDDLIALVFSDPAIAFSINNRIYNSEGFLNENGEIEWARYFYRNPGFIAHCYYGSFLLPSVWLRFAWAVSVILCCFKSVGNQDAWMQTDLMIRTYLRCKPTRTPVCDWAVRTWMRYKPKPIWAICMDYIGYVDHPLVLAWKAAKEIRVELGQLTA